MDARVEAISPRFPALYPTPIAHHSDRSPRRSLTHRGEDVEIAEGEIPGTIEITTVAPQWEGVRVVVELSGAAGWASEQSAPDFGPADLMTSTPRRCASPAT